MNATIYVNFFLAAKSEKGKERVCARIAKIIEKEIEYLTLKKTDISKFEIAVAFSSWEACVYNAIEFCQKIGYDWSLSGYIKFDFDAWSNHPKIVGVEAIEVAVRNPFATQEVS
ncbi:MAG: hypothetical protein LBO72_06165 [Helicobacteraceae bacterium]|nr:hypothetical protein [Helicobacteraceae bacterium]